MKTLSVLLLVCIVILVADVKSLKNARSFRNSQLSIDGDHVEMKAFDDDDLSFLVIGDWGGLPDSPYRTVIELDVADTMTKYAKAYNTKFQIALGDNFYFDGVKNAKDQRFQSTFEEVFKSEPLMNTPWFFILGNHDHYGNASAQISYMQNSKRWIFPNYNYTMTVNGSQPDRTFIKFLFIDTVLMCGNTKHDQAAGQPQFTSQKDRLDSNDYFKAFEKELQHVTETEQIDYLFVAGHFPVWSIAEHGPTKCLVENLRPLLHKYSVSGYLSGHDHNLQHISDEYKDSRVEYFLSGAANFIDNSTEHMKSVPAGSLKYHYGDASGVVNGGLCLFKATQSNLTVTYLDSKGLELYQTVIHPRD